MITLYTDEDRAKAAEVESEAQKIAAERGAKQAVYMAEALDKELQKYDESLRSKLRAAYETPGDKRSDEQNALLKQYPTVNSSPGERVEIASIDESIPTTGRRQAYAKWLLRRRSLTNKWLT
ncbi:MAG: hypothetical protein ABI614_08305 [Planctomycetota bacterium]